MLNINISLGLTYSMFINIPDAPCWQMNPLTVYRFGKRSKFLWLSCGSVDSNRLYRQRKKRFKLRKLDLSCSRTSVSSTITINVLKMNDIILHIGLLIFLETSPAVLNMFLKHYDHEHNWLQTHLTMSYFNRCPAPVHGQFS